MIEDECLNIQDYDEACQRTLSQEHSENEWRCMFVNYDDTPRRHEKGIVYQGSTPQKFGKYLQATLVKSKNEKSRYVFINAWIFIAHKLIMNIFGCVVMDWCSI